MSTLLYEYYAIALFQSSYHWLLLEFTELLGKIVRNATSRKVAVAGSFVRNEQGAFLKFIWIISQKFRCPQNRTSGYKKLPVVQHFFSDSLCHILNNREYCIFKVGSDSYFKFQIFLAKFTVLYRQITSIKSLLKAILFCSKLKKIAFASTW